MQNIFTNGMENAPKRALLRSMGVTREEIKRPIIGIVYSHNDTVAAHSDPDKMLQNIKEGIIAQGGKPVSATVMSICSGISMGNNGRYLLPSREVIADSIESLVFASGFDAVVFMGSCDSTVPAMLIAAVRINIPCVFISPGSSLAGFSGDKKAAFSKVLEGVYAAKSGRISAFDLDELEEQCCPTPGSGAEMSTSNTMCCITEALGLAPCYSGSLAMGSSKRLSLAKDVGGYIIQALNQQLTPSRILTLSALKNAVRLVMAIGGSLDSIIHLTALAHELKINIDKIFNYDLIAKLSATTPALAKLAPATDFFMEDFNRAGGVPAVMGELAKLGLLEDSLSIHNQSVLQLYESTQSKNTAIIHSHENPITPTGAINILYGNLAEDGCFIRSLYAQPAANVFSGPAKVFDSEEDALYALSLGQVKPGDIIVVRYEGPKGAPGMREMRAVAAAITGMGLENKVALITDGRVGGTSKGITIGHVCPEAAEGGLLAMVENGDKIDIDFSKKKITLDVPAKILKPRQKQFKPRRQELSGMLLRYSENVSSCKRGTVLKDKF